MGPTPSGPSSTCTAAPTCLALRGLAAQIAVSSRTPVHLLDYRLGPENAHPAGLEGSLAAYRELAAELGHGSVVIVGAWAGRGRAVALAARLRHSGED